MCPFGMKFQDGNNLNCQSLGVLELVDQKHPTAGGGGGGLTAIAGHKVWGGKDWVGGGGGGEGQLLQTMKRLAI